MADAYRYTYSLISLYRSSTYFLHSRVCLDHMNTYLLKREFLYWLNFFYQSFSSFLIAFLFLFSPFSSQSILPSSLVEYQSLRCRVAFHALHFRAEIVELAHQMVKKWVTWLLLVFVSHSYVDRFWIKLPYFVFPVHVVFWLHHWKTIFSHTA